MYRALVVEVYLECYFWCLPFELPHHRDAGLLVFVSLACLYAVLIPLLVAAVWEIMRNTCGNSDLLVAILLALQLFDVVSSRKA